VVNAISTLVVAGLGVLILVSGKLQEKK